MDKDYNLNKDERVNTKKGLSLIVRHFKPYLFTLVLISFALLASNILGVVLIPKLVQRSIDIDIANKDIDGLLNTVTTALFVLIFTAIANYIRVRTTGILSQKVLFNIREEIFKKIQELPTQFVSDNQTGDIIQRLTGNVDGLNKFFSEGLVRLMNISFMMLTILTMLFSLDWRIASISLLSTTAVFVFLLVQGKFLEKPIKQALDKEGMVSAKVQESLDGFLPIQSNNQQGYWSKQLESLTQSYYKTSKKVSAISASADTFITMMSILSVGTTLLYSLHLMSAGIVTLGMVVLFNAYSRQLFSGLNKISYIWQNIKTGLASASRLSEILELENNIFSPKKAYSPKDIKGGIEFRDVNFGYNSNDVVLKDINFVAYPGKTIAIVGPTGGGKTTFVNLIARLYDVKSGKILVDGTDVKDWDLDTLRKGIGYLIQDTFLFEDSILNNLRYDNSRVTEQEALDMFKFLGVSPFIKSLPKGLHTKIGSDGDGLSSGQRQIIALARILLRDPKILVLDEATARIDTKSEKLLQVAIEKAIEGKTTFVIAHRLSTIFNANHIILIKDNTILEQGNHKQLIEQKGFYYEMYSKFAGD